MKYITFTVSCYNSQDYMERCIDSLLIGGEDVEIIIVNDGSSDRTGEIAEHMLPVPGSQGITEIMYKTVFANVFPAQLLMPSMLVSRSINFYVLLLVSLGVVIIQKISKGNHKKYKYK